MITAETLNTLISCDNYALISILKRSGYSGVSFKNSKFLGITNGGQFCYSITYHDEDGTGESHDKVFLTYNVANDTITASYMSK